MTHKEIKQIKKRIALRKKTKPYQSTPSFTEQSQKNQSINESSDLQNNNLEFNGNSSYNWFILQVLMSALLVIGVAFINRAPSKNLGFAKKIVGQAFTTNFPFAKTSEWITNKAGSLYSFLPFDLRVDEKKVSEIDSAVPVSGKIVESFEKNGRGILVETGANKAIKAMEAGVVIKAFVDELLGQVVVVQQANDVNVWYGGMGEIKVGLYQHVKKNDVLGLVTNNSDGVKGSYTLAVEQDGKFIDPVSVLTFE